MLKKESDIFGFGKQNPESENFVGWNVWWYRWEFV
jgi:hypothetical protein